MKIRENMSAFSLETEAWRRRGWEMKGMLG
jgi:hypothetical protein